MKILIRKYRHFFLGFTLLGTFFFTATACYHIYKPLPKGISFAGSVHPIEDIAFYKDITWVDNEGKRHSQQEIFDKILLMIDGARNIVVLDMFLFNDFIGKGQSPYRRLAEEITEALVDQKVKFPDLLVVVITDPVNTVYNGLTNRYFERMKSANIHVVFSNLERLRDSNPAYSAFWRIFIKPFGNSSGALLPNPLGKGRVSLRSYLAMLNFKANHRKLIICDDADTYSALITSANPHDGSSAHGNVAIYFKGPAVFDLLQSEQAVLDFSGGPSLPKMHAKKTIDLKTDITTQILSERKIKDALIKILKQAGKGDKLAIMVFYLSDREIINQLKRAFNRGAEVRVILDPNKDAFGRKKNGIPNRQVASELMKLGIPVRWSNTHGEQSHTKMLLAEYFHGQSVAILGSANFTRRNLNNLNLETDIAVYGPASSSLFMNIREYINLQWHNKDGIKYSLGYSEYEDNFFYRKLIYRWMEETGMSTF